MTTSTILPLAFRCNKCWQLTCAGSDQVGSSTPCLSCSTHLVVPEADEKTLAAGAEFMATAESCPQQQINLNEELSDEQVDKMVREIADAEWKANGTPETLVCSRWKRLLGAIIDSVAAFVAIMLGLVLSMAIGAIGAQPGTQIDPSVIIVMFILPAMLGICQCYLIATEGRTIGKYCVKSKIVNLKGQPPGFLQGVILRIFVVALLGMIPFFNLVNVLWIFNEPKRCLHDYIAGTFVIDA